MFEKKSVTVMFAGLAALILLFGLLSFGLPVTSYIRSVVLITAAFVMFTELTVAKVTNASKLKKFGIQQWLTLATGVVLFVTGIAALPFIAREIAYISYVSGYAMLVGAVMLLGEAFMPSKF